MLSSLPAVTGAKQLRAKRVTAELDDVFVRQIAKDAQSIENAKASDIILHALSGVITCGAGASAFTFGVNEAYVWTTLGTLAVYAIAAPLLARRVGKAQVALACKLAMGPAVNCGLKNGEMLALNGVYVCEAGTDLALLIQSTARRV